MKKLHTKVKIASLADVKAGRAVFCIRKARSRPYDLGFLLPVRAVLRGDMDFGGKSPPLVKGTVLKIVQAEIVNEEDVVLGFKHYRRDGVCMLTEVEIIGPWRPSTQSNG